MRAICGALFASRPAEAQGQAQAEADCAGLIRRLRRALGHAAASCLAVVAVATAVGCTRDDPVPREPHAPSDPRDDLVDAQAPVPAPAPAPAAQALPPSPAATLNITRRGVEWHIEAVGVSRLVAAQRLAQASGSPLFGDIAGLAAAAPLHLNWQGPGTASAWQVVLGSEVSFATQCGAVRCRVWIIGVTAKELGPTSAHASSVAPPGPATVDADAATPRADSADPRIAAHHD